MPSGARNWGKSRLALDGVPGFLHGYMGACRRMHRNLRAASSTAYVYGRRREIRSATIPSVCQREAASADHFDCIIRELLLNVDRRKLVGSLGSRKFRLK